MKTPGENLSMFIIERVKTTSVEKLGEYKTTRKHYLGREIREIQNNVLIYHKTWRYVEMYVYV